MRMTKRSACLSRLRSCELQAGLFRDFRVGQGGLIRRSQAGAPNPQKLSQKVYIVQVL